MHTRSAPQSGQMRSCSGTGTTRGSGGRFGGNGERPPRFGLGGGFGGSGGWGILPSELSGGFTAPVALSGASLPSAASIAEMSAVETFWLLRPYSSRSALRSLVVSALWL